MFMNRAGIRDAIRLYLSGYPERDSAGTERLNNAINLALRKLWGDLPKVLIREEMNFALQPQIEGTCAVRSDDARIMALETTTATLSTSGEHTGRWVDITDSSGMVHTFRIRDVFRSTMDRFVLDRPWFNATDSGLAYRIYTKEYPVPADVKSVQHVMVKTASEKPRDLTIVGMEQMALIQASQGMDDEGRVEFAGLGDFFQLPAPQFTPVTSKHTQPVNAQKWGWDPTAGPAEESSYEPAGTFSYRCCLVWGRRPAADGKVRPGGATVAATSAGERLPFYISSASEPSDQIATTWGGSRIIVTSPNVDLEQGYSYPGEPADGYAGLEKWWFRARHAVDTAAGSDHTAIQADGVYRLWHISDASTTLVYDYGQRYPLAQMVLKDHYGHRHIRFDKSPSDSTTSVIARVIKTPPTLTHDSDSPNLPPDSIHALVYAVGAVLAGHRDGNLTRAAQYEQLYYAELEKLRREYGTDHFPDEPMGNALGTGVPRSRLWGISDWESS